MTFNEWHKNNAKYMEPTDIVAWCQAAYKAGAAAEREECAKVCEPKTSRPCDCKRCECGNTTDARMVSAWDESANIAFAIRARGQG